jgi:hypothetical protein
MKNTINPEMTVEALSPLLIPGKSANRIHPGYKMGSDDWKAEYNMLLMDGVTCKSCVKCNRCTSLYGSKETDTSCQWHPNMFVEVSGLSEKGGSSNG